MTAKRYMPACKLLVHWSSGCLCKIHHHPQQQHRNSLYMVRIYGGRSRDLIALGGTGPGGGGTYGTGLRRPRQPPAACAALPACCCGTAAAVTCFHSYQGGTGRLRSLHCIASGFGAAEMHRAAIVFHFLCLTTSCTTSTCGKSVSQSTTPPFGV